MDHDALACQIARSAWLVVNFTINPVAAMIAPPSRGTSAIMPATPPLAAEVSAAEVLDEAPSLEAPNTVRAAALLIVV